jgi:peroxidase
MGLKPGRYPTLETEFLTSLQQLCFFDNNTVTDLDLKTPVTFDKQYYENLPSGQGLLDSDQLLYSNGGSTRKLVENFSSISGKAMEVLPVKNPRT